jgi:hypothetical protein
LSPGVLSLATAVTAILASGLFLATRSATGHGAMQSWAMLTPLRFLAAPMLALFFLLAGLIAPTRARVRHPAARSVEHCTTPVASAVRATHMVSWPRHAGAPRLVRESAEVQVE